MSLQATENQRHRQTASPYSLASVPFSRFLSASNLLLARIVGAGAGFLTQLILARFLSPDALGTFFAATSLAAVVGLIVTQGYPGIAQRFVTRYRTKNKHKLLAGFAKRVEYETAAFTCLVAALLSGAAVLWPRITVELRVVYVATAVCIAAASSFTIFGAFAAVERRFALAQFPETLFRPILFLSVTAVVAASGGVAASAGAAMVAYTGISVLLAAAQYALLRSSLPDGVAVSHRRLTGAWRREARTFALTVLFATLFADLAILLASPFLGAYALAPFGVALKISLLVGFAVQIAHQVALPDLAEARALKNTDGIRTALLQGTAFPATVTMLALVTAVCAGEWILALFGPEFVAAKWPLVILVAAQVVRAIAGPAPSLLMLAGEQIANAIICSASAAVLLLSNATLIPFFGITGASWAVLLSLLTWVTASGAYLWWRAGLRVDIAVLLRTQ
jgi:O-antigen/teichoic acid export membrane protein